MIPCTFLEKKSVDVFTSSLTVKLNECTNNNKFDVSFIFQNILFHFKIKPGIVELVANFPHNLQNIQIPLIHFVSATLFLA